MKILKAILKRWECFVGSCPWKYSKTSRKTGYRTCKRCGRVESTLTDMPLREKQTFIANIWK